MSRLEAAQVRTVLYEGPGSLALEPETRSRLVTALLDKGFAVTSLRSNAPVNALPRDFVLVLGRFAGEPPQLAGGTAIRFQQIDGMDTNAVVEAAENLTGETGAAKAGTWKPWFPVIDYGAARTACSASVFVSSMCMVCPRNVSIRSATRTTAKRNARRVRASVPKWPSCFRSIGTARSMATR